MAENWCHYDENVDKEDKEMVERVIKLGIKVCSEDAQLLSAFNRPELSSSPTIASVLDLRHTLLV